MHANENAQKLINPSPIEKPSDIGGGVDGGGK